jgi:D-threo-aldose 1-dehydrogenase
MRSVESSLRRLDVARIDILYIHEPTGPIGPVMDGAYRALERLRADGAVTAIGVGDNDPTRLAEFVREGDFDCMLLGRGYTLLDTSAASVLFPIATERGVAIIVGGPFASGILADPRPGSTMDYRPATNAELDRARSIADVAAHHGSSLKAAALQFAVRHPAVASVLVGARSAREVEEDATLFSQATPASMWRELADRGLVAEDRASAA